MAASDSAPSILTSGLNDSPPTAVWASWAHPCHVAPLQHVAQEYQETVKRLHDQIYCSLAEVSATVVQAVACCDGPSSAASHV